MYLCHFVDQMGGEDRSSKKLLRKGCQGQQLRITQHWRVSRTVWGVRMLPHLWTWERKRWKVQGKGGRGMEKQARPVNEPEMVFWHERRVADVIFVRKSFYNRPNWFWQWQGCWCSIGCAGSAVLAWRRGRHLVNCFAIPPLHLLKH